MGAVILFLKSGLGRSLSIGAVFLIVLGSCAVQSARLKSAKSDLAEARAALYVPDANGKPTRVTWKAAHAACMVSVGDLSKAVDDQSAKVRANAEAAQRQLAQAQSIAEEAQRGRASAEKKAAGLAALVKNFGPGQCRDADLAAADAAVLETVR